MHIQAKPEWRALLAEAEAERDELRRDKALETLQAAFPKTWVAAAWYLERRHPELYALKTVQRNLNSIEAPVGDAIPESRLLEYGKQMAESQRFPRTSSPKISFTCRDPPLTRCALLRTRLRFATGVPDPWQGPKLFWTLCIFWTPE
jgi:hypothetical protein